MGAGVRKRAGGRERDPAVWSRAWRQARQQRLHQQWPAQVAQSKELHACVPLHVVWVRTRLAEKYTLPYFGMCTCAYYRPFSDHQEVGVWAALVWQGGDDGEPRERRWSQTPALPRRRRLGRRTAKQRMGMLGRELRLPWESPSCASPAAALLSRSMPSCSCLRRPYLCPGRPLSPQTPQQPRCHHWGLE